MKKLFAFFCLLQVGSLAQSQDIDMVWGVKIPMRDGVQLNATVYKPHNPGSKLPVIFTLTPYIGDSYYARASYFSKHGFVFVLVDVRGRGSSEGQFDPFIQEAKDGYDIVEWLAKQDYSNGKITMWGGSYAGYDQWATAKEIPPHLSTIVPVAAAKPGVDFPMTYNVTSSYILRWLTYTSGKTGNGNLFNDNDFWQNKYNERFQKDLRFTSLDSIAGNPSPIFQKWLAHPTVDDYWKSHNPTPAQYAAMNFPILSITGSYDGDQPGAIAFYREYMQYATEKGKSNHWLLIGPWDHAGTRTPNAAVGGLVFGDKSMLDMNKLHEDWYNFAMRDSARPAFLKNKVGYFITNRNEWKWVGSLDDIGKEKKSFYLANVGGQANDLLHSGSLLEKLPANTGPSAYVYDPMDKSSAAMDLHPPDNYLTDQSYANAISKFGLVYHTAPFTEETEVSGFFELDIYLETDVKDIDVEADIYELKPDGTSVLLTTAIVRARYRDGLESGKLLEPNKTYLLPFRNFTFISRTLEKGSRLRLLVSTPNSMNFEKNYGSGGMVSHETGKDAHTARVRIFHDGARASVIRMPIMK